MMSDVNSIVLSGRLGRDPESRTFGENVKTSLRIASTRRWGPGDDKRETLWMDVDCWGNLAKVTADICTKGQEVTVVGRLTIENWTDKEGVPKSKMVIVASDISFGAKPAAAGGEAPVDKEALKQKMKTLMEMVKGGVDQDAAIAVLLGQ